MFINFSNHPSTGWGNDQMEAAMKYGQVQDVPFPAVSATAGKEDIKKIVRENVDKIMSFDPDCVMCMGEFSVAVAVIRMLQGRGVKCVCACTDREALEKVQEDGTIIKTSRFRFVQFREYL